MNTYKTIILSLILTIGLFSCSNEDLNPLPEITTRVGLVRGEQTVHTSGDIGGYIYVHATPSGDQIGLEDPIIEIDIDAPQGNVDSYTLMAKISGMAEDSDDPAGYGDYIPIATVTEFPNSISINLTEFGAAFGMTPEDFSLSPTTTPQYLHLIGTSVSNGITVNLDNVTGAGFSSADNPDGVTSGLTNLYQESRYYILRYYP